MQIRCSLFALGLLASVTTAWAQALDAGAPAFEVATVRENQSGEARFHIEVLPGGRFNAINMTLWHLISVAYPINGRFPDEIQLVGGPPWIKSARFDIVAKAEGSPMLDTNKPGATVTDGDRNAVERVRLMLRQLLADRFQMRIHQETRHLPIYHLVLAKPQAGIGPALRAAAPDCASLCGSIKSTAPGNVTATSVAMGSIAHTMSVWVKRTVVDRTGIDGNWDFTLTYAPEGVSESSAPSIFTAVQEQLGLKLEPTTGPVDVLVVDSAQRPVPE
jgi:uncharacterized protein (TIGR03435 family)